LDTDGEGGDVESDNGRPMEECLQHWGYQVAVDRLHCTEAEVKCLMEGF